MADLTFPSGYDRIRLCLLCQPRLRTRDLGRFPKQAALGSNWRVADSVIVKGAFQPSTNLHFCFILLVLSVGTVLGQRSFYFVLVLFCLESCSMFFSCKHGLEQPILVLTVKSKHNELSTRSGIRTSKPAQIRHYDLALYPFEAVALS